MKKKPSGCLIAFLIVFGIVFTVVLAHLAVGLYLYSKKFESRHLDEAPAESAPFDSSASASPA
jgi:hypothetical protein